MAQEMENKKFMEVFRHWNDVLEWLNTMDVFVGVLDKNGVLLFCNEQPLIAGGLTYKDVLDRYFPDCQWWSHSEKERLKIVDCIEEGKKGISSRVETNFMSSEGTPFQIIFDLQPVFDEDGSIKYLNAEGKVIEVEYRLRKELEEIKAGLEERVMERTRELEIANKSLVQAQKMEAIGRLAGGVAHDFNNMLSVIIGYAELISSKFSPQDPVLHDIEEIKKAAEHSTNLTRQLLAFSRKQPISPKPVSINTLVADMEKMISRLIGEDIDVLFVPGNDLWIVNLDPSQMEQVTINLTLNARDAMPNGGKLVIKTENIVLDETYCSEHPGFKPVQFVNITISDNGRGMDRETLENIFEPFFTTKESGKGTGLGLATVYGIVKQNNGFINVYSEPGEGTEFSIYLPRWCENEETIEIPIKKEVLPKYGTILLVEDDEMVLELTKIMLNSNGHNVIAFSSPNKAITCCKKENIDIHILLTDVVMPEMNGKDLSDTIKIIKPEIQTIFMSGYPDEIITRHGMLEKETNFINKPFTKDGLLSKVQEVLEKLEK